MNLNKKELIISVILILILALLIIGFNANVLATSSNTAGSLNDYLNLSWGAGNNSNNNIPQIPINNTNNTSNEVQNIPVNNSVNNTNTPGKVPNTGLEDAPWLIIGICVVSATFAYKKIKEYKID